MAGFLTTIFSNISSLIIGLVYSPEDLAFYSKGLQLPKMISSTINDSSSSATLSKMSTLQDSLPDLKLFIRSTIRHLNFITFPILAGLFSTSSSLVLILFGESWISAAFFLKVGTISFSMIIMQVVIQNAFNSIGRSDLFLKMDIIAKVFSLTILIITFNLGVRILALGAIFTSIFNFFIKVIYSKKVFKYRFKEHIEDNLIIALPSILMGILTTYIGTIINDLYIRVIIQVIFGVVIYFIISIIFKTNKFQKMFHLIINYIKID